jgi:hypothetical protein
MVKELEKLKHWATGLEKDLVMGSAKALEKLKVMEYL